MLGVIFDIIEECARPIAEGINTFLGGSDNRRSSRRNSSSSSSQRTSRNNRQRERDERSRKEIEKITREIKNINQDNERLKEILSETKQANAGFREEMLRREKERQEEMQRVKEQQEENTKEQRRIQKRLRKMKIREEKQCKEKEAKLKKRDEQLKSENEEYQQQQQRMEEDTQLSEEQKEKLIEGIEEAKIIFKELIQKNKTTLIEEKIKELKQDTVVLKKVFTESNIERSTFWRLSKAIADIYENLGDLFYQQELNQKAVDMYEEVANLLPFERYNDKFLFKYGRALYKVSKYEEALKYLDDFDIWQLNKIERDAISYELDNLYFNIYLNLENTVKIESKIKDLVAKYGEDKSRFNDLLNLLAKYIEYVKEEEQMITYFALLSRYKKRSNLKEKLDNELYNDFKYRDFYLGLQEYQDGNLELAIDKLDIYSDNELTAIYSLLAKNQADKIGEIEIEQVEKLITKLETMLVDGNKESREKFYQTNDRLIYLDVSNTEHFFRLYLKLKQVKFDYLFANGNYDCLLNSVKQLEEEYFKKKDFKISSRFKRRLADYYHFFAKQDSEAKAEMLKDILAYYSTELELESYLSQDYEFEKELEELYEITDQKISYLESPFYYSFLVYNRASDKQHIMIETYVENLSQVKKQRREEALQKEKILGEKYNNFATIYYYIIQEGVTKVVYPYLKDNFKNYMEENQLLEAETIAEKKNYAKQLVDIFAILEKEEIYLPNLNPSRIMIDQFDQLIMQDTYLGQTFRSESSTSAGSIKNFRNNMYKAPDESKDRGKKTNYYLLGLLLYELFYGEYIFNGVKEYKTIRYLHEERQVDRSKVFSLRDRWIETKDSTQTRVEKIMIKKESKLPIEIQELLKQLIAAAQAKRPDSLEEIRRELENLKAKDVGVDISRSVSKNDLVKFMNSYSELKLHLGDLGFKEELLDRVEDLNIVGQCEDKEKMLLETEKEDYLIKKIGLRYKIDKVSSDDKRNIVVESLEEDNSSNEEIEVEIDKIIADISNLLLEKEELADYLFQTRKCLQDIDQNNEWQTNLDKSYKEEIKSVTKKVSLADINLSLEQLNEEEFLRLTVRIIEKIKEK